MLFVNINPCHRLFCKYSDDGRPSSASIFVGGFILGGLIVGTLGCVYAPQVVFVTVRILVQLLNVSMEWDAT